MSAAVELRVFCLSVRYVKKQGLKYAKPQFCLFLSIFPPSTDSKFL